MIRLAVVFLAIWLPLGAVAQNTVVIGSIPTSTGVLPDGQILIRNASGYDLSVWISADDAGWQRYDIVGENSALISSRAAVVAIATTEDGDGFNAAEPPSRAPSAVSGDGAAEGFFFYRRLTGGTRALFCWSPGNDRWMVQAFGEQVCT